MHPFTPTDRSRESYPRWIASVVQTEMIVAERRPHALEGELCEAVGAFCARETWWRNNLQELQNIVGTERSSFEQLALTAETDFRDRLGTLEDSVNRSRQEVQANEKSAQQHRQSLVQLENFAQQIQDDGLSRLGHADAAVRSLTDEVSQLQADQAKLASVNEQGRLENEAVMMRETQQQLVGLRTELGETTSSAGTAND